MCRLQKAIPPAKAEEDGVGARLRTLPGNVLWGSKLGRLRKSNMMKTGKMEGEGQDVGPEMAGEGQDEGATWQGRDKMAEGHAGICLEPCMEAGSVPWSSEGCCNCS